MSDYLNYNQTFQLCQRTITTFQHVFLFFAIPFGLFFIMVLSIRYLSIDFLTAAIVLAFAALFSTLALEKLTLVRAKVTTSGDKFYLAITKPGWHLDETTFTYTWDMLQDFRYFHHRSGADLTLRWTDGSKQKFVRGDIDAFIGYLMRRFPDNYYRY